MWHSLPVAAGTVSGRPAELQYRQDGPDAEAHCTALAPLVHSRAVGLGQSMVCVAVLVSGSEVGGVGMWLLLQELLLVGDDLLPVENNN